MIVVAAAAAPGACWAITTAGQQGALQQGQLLE
jgi:hypothetical protein